MRRLLALPAILALMLAAAACGSGSASSTQGAPASGGPASCSAGSLQLHNPGTLTIGTDNPAYAPFFTGGPGHEWKGKYSNDPYTGKGFEDAVAYAVAKQLGFTSDQVSWVPLKWSQSYKPGPKDFDFYLSQISYKPVRTKAADLSDSYYDVNQAVVAIKGTPITTATSVADLKQYKLGSEVGSTGYDYITNTIQPSQSPQAFSSTPDALKALQNGSVDGLVEDFPTAWYMANVQLSNGALVGQFPAAAGGEHYSIVLPKDSPLTACVNQALASLKSDGTLPAIQKQWLSELQHAPEFQ